MNSQLRHQIEVNGQLHDQEKKLLLFIISCDLEGLRAVSMFWRTLKFFTPAWSQRRFLCLFANSLVTILSGLLRLFPQNSSFEISVQVSVVSFITKVFSILARYDAAGHEYYYIRILLFRSGFSLRPCSGSDGQLPTCHLGVPVCFPDQSMCYLRPTKWQWGTFSPIT